MIMTDFFPFVGYRVLSITVISLFLLGAQKGVAQEVQPAGTTVTQDSGLGQLDPTYAAMRSIIERFIVDRGSSERADRLPMSGPRRDRQRDFFTKWLQGLNKVDFTTLDQDGRVDYLLFQNELTHQLRQLDYDTVRDQEVKPLLPFATDLVQLLEQRREMQVPVGRTAATRLAEIRKQVESAKDAVGQGTAEAKKVVANRAVQRIGSLQRSLRRWFDFYAGYDPEFTWWVRKPYESLDKSLTDHSAAVKKKFIGDDKDDIIGDPIGRDALLSELEHEMIAYSPKELIEIANQEFAWCDREMLRASHDLGFGDDWHKALEHVKNQYVEPGKQPQLIRDQALEAIRFLDDRDLVTIPPLCRTSWRIAMMSPRLQRVNPYFTGGEVISVSFPTDSMSHDEKLMSLRSNNIHFCRATVHHELIPGHHLQLFMADRYRTHRKLFRTPFLVEGWALHWELLLWDLDFAQSPENRVGMLFWRMHRCARIILSLGFHLEQQEPPEMIDFLVERVGHERSAAEAEVRRWVGGEYGPLYQAAYMLGGLQIRALHRELVQSGKMTNRAFHDAILKQNAIPIDMIRATLTGTELSPGYRSDWRFYDNASATE